MYSWKERRAETAENDVEISADRYRRSCRKGTDWLLAHGNADGSIGPVGQGLFYYRAPWALSLVGETAAAHRVLDWIGRHMFNDEGAFEGVSPQGGFEHRYGSYPLACLLVGASMQQRHDIVYRGTRHLLAWQDPQSGGFWNTLPQDPDGEQDLFPTCQGGMTLLQVGRLEEAVRAGTWLVNLWALQPDARDRLYAVYSPSRGLVTEYPHEHAPTYVTLKNDPWQHHYNGGIAAAFLAQLYLATAERSWLDAARRFQDFSMTTDDCQFRSMQVCKSGWGSGLLHVATREGAYKDWTRRMGDWFVENQFSDGHWENTAFWTPDPTLANNVELTTEFVMHVANIIAYLSV